MTESSPTKVPKKPDTTKRQQFAPTASLVMSFISVQGWHRGDGQLGHEKASQRPSRWMHPISTRRHDRGSIRNFPTTRRHASGRHSYTTADRRGGGGNRESRLVPESTQSGPPPESVQSDLRNVGLPKVKPYYCMMQGASHPEIQKVAVAPLPRPSAHRSLLLVMAPDPNLLPRLTRRPKVLDAVGVWGRYDGGTEKIVGFRLSEEICIGKARSLICFNPGRLAKDLESLWQSLGISSFGRRADDRHTTRSWRSWWR